MVKILKLSILSLLIFATSCKKEKVEEDKTETTEEVVEANGNGLFWQINHLFNGASFSLNTKYADDFGNAIQFSRATFYLSQPKIYAADKTEVSTCNNYFLVHHNTTELLIDNMNTSATVDSLSLYIGVDGTKNHEDPALYDTGKPLAFQSPSMHWGWTDGYLFTVIEGNVDTNGDGSFDDVFAFHIGLDSYLTLIESNTGLDIAASNQSKSYVTIDINYDLLFNGIDLSVDNSTHTLNNPTLATSFVANIPNAILIK